MTKNARTVTFVLIFAGLFAIMAIYFGIVKKQRFDSSSSDFPVVIKEGTWMTQPQALSSFVFTDNEAKPFTNQNLKGRWTLLFFGFTNCGYVCPTTLSTLNKAYTELSAKLPKEALPQVVMFTVDPVRDTTERMNDYVKAFNPNFKGIRGTEQQSLEFENELHVVATKIEAKDGNPNNYMVDHSTQLMLINPKGQLQGFFDFPEKAEVLVENYENIIAKKKA